MWWEPRSISDHANFVCLRVNRSRMKVSACSAAGHWPVKKRFWHFELITAASSSSAGCEGKHVHIESEVEAAARSSPSSAELFLKAGVQSGMQTKKHFKFLLSLIMRLYRSEVLFCLRPQHEHTWHQCTWAHVKSIPTLTSTRSFLIAPLTHIVVVALPDVSPSCEVPTRNKRTIRAEIWWISVQRVQS